MSKKQNISYFSPSIVRRRDKNKRIYFIDKKSGKRRDKNSWEQSLSYRKDKERFVLSESEKEFINVVELRTSFDDDEESENDGQLSVFVHELKRLSNIFLFKMKRGKIKFEGETYNKSNSFYFLNRFKNKLTQLYKDAKNGVGSSLIKSDISIKKGTLTINDIYS